MDMYNLVKPYIFISVPILLGIQMHQLITKNFTIHKIYDYLIRPFLVFNMMIRNCDVALLKLFDISKYDNVKTNAINQSLSQVD